MCLVCVVTYLGYLLEAEAHVISAKSLQPYLSVINVVRNGNEPQSPVCVHLVRLVHKGFAELQGSDMLQPQQVTVFPSTHMFVIVQSGFDPTVTSPSTTFVCVLVWMLNSRSSAALILDSGVLLSVINDQASDSTSSIHKSAKNVARNQAAPLSRVSSDQDDPHN